MQKIKGVVVVVTTRSGFKACLKFHIQLKNPTWHIAKCIRSDNNEDRSVGQENQTTRKQRNPVFKFRSHLEQPLILG